MDELTAVLLSVFGMALAGIIGFRMVRRGRGRTVEAEQFVVRDATGKRRAKFGMSEDGGVRLRLFDGNDASCVSLGVTPKEYARLHLYDQQGTLRVGLGVFPEDAGVGVVLNDQAGRPRLTCTILETGAADVRVLDEDGKILWTTH